MREAIVFDADRTGYSIGQVERPMTVGELMELLRDYNEDTLVILSHDSGYTYGTLSNLRPAYEHDDEEWEEEDW